MPETVKVLLPEMGESVTEGSIVEWRKKIGDFVAEGDPLVEITTDKVDVEVPATTSGVVTQILAREGDTVAVGSVLAEIDASKGNGASTSLSTGAASRTGGDGAATKPAPPAAPPTPKPAPAPVAVEAPVQPSEALADAPARRIAERLGVDLRKVRGSGPDGLILRSDVTQ